jgi:hypothetical protein
MADKMERLPRHITVPLLTGEPWLLLRHDNGKETHIGEADMTALLGLAARLEALEGAVRLLLRRDEELTRELVQMSHRLGLT